MSALCHVRTSPLAIDHSRLSVHAHRMSCHSDYVTLRYRWLPSMHTWRHTYFPQRLRPQHICDICDLFVSHINVLTYFLTYIHTGSWKHSKTLSRWQVQVLRTHLNEWHTIILEVWNLLWKLWIHQHHVNDKNTWSLFYFDIFIPFCLYFTFRIMRIICYNMFLFCAFVVFCFSMKQNAMVELYE